MQIEGRQIGLATKVISLPSSGGPLEVTIRAVPFGTNDRAARLFPEPRPPIKLRTKANGAVVRDDKGRPIKEADANDPGYLAEHDRCLKLRAMVSIYEALRADPRITWDASATMADDTPAFYVAIYQEFADSGLSEGAYSLLSAAIVQLSMFGLDEAEDAAGSFA